MLKLRLTRTGSKDKAQYRIIVVESATKRDGRFVENIGYYNPRTEPSTIVIKLDRADYWMKNGAQPTDSVASILKRARAANGDTVATPVAASSPTVNAPTAVVTAPVMPAPVAAPTEPVAVVSTPEVSAPVEFPDAPESAAMPVPAPVPESPPATTSPGA